MKVVLDTMLWVSYCTRRGGSRHRLIEQAFKARVRSFCRKWKVGGKVRVSDSRHHSRNSRMLCTNLSVYNPSDFRREKLVHKCHAVFS